MCINRPLHQAWFEYQATHPKPISYTTPCKACCSPQKQQLNYGSSISGPPPKSSKYLRCNSASIHPGECYDYVQYRQLSIIVIFVLIRSYRNFTAALTTPVNIKINPPLKQVYMHPSYCLNPPIKINQKLKIRA